MSTQPTCPSCKKPGPFREINGGRHWRCGNCSWLCIKTATGAMTTAIPAAVKSKPAKSKPRPKPWQVWHCLPGKEPWVEQVRKERRG